MDYRKSPRTTVYGREQLARMVLKRGFTQKAAAALFRVSEKTAGKWVRRFQEQGREGPQFAPPPQPAPNPIPLIG